MFSQCHQCYQCYQCYLAEHMHLPRSSQEPNWLWERQRMKLSSCFIYIIASISVYGIIIVSLWKYYIYTLEVDFYDKIPSKTETSVSAEVEVVIRMGVWPPKNRYKVWYKRCDLRLIDLKLTTLPDEREDKEMEDGVLCPEDEYPTVIF